MFKRFVWVFTWPILFALVIAAMPANHVQAYLDPGSGSLIIQVVIGAILGALVLVRVYWSKIVGFVSGKKSSEAQDNIPMSSDQGTPTSDNRP